MVSTNLERSQYYSRMNTWISRFKYRIQAVWIIYPSPPLSCVRCSNWPKAEREPGVPCRESLDHICFLRLPQGPTSLPHISPSVFSASPLPFQGLFPVTWNADFLGLTPPVWISHLRVPSDECSRLWWDAVKCGYDKCGISTFIQRI